ncbi:MAG: tetratricopeptide repeat protein [Verrucomicrobia bacterium]|nr:tetratricopeptide repeat protein [Verrucomicrobiota bacterium]
MSSAAELTQQAAAAMQTGRLAEAGPLLVEALAAARREHTEPHAQILEALRNLGEWHRLGQQWDAAEARLREALAQGHALGGPAAGHVLSRLGTLYGRIGRLDEAESAHREAVAHLERTLSPQAPPVAEALGPLAHLLAHTGRAAAAVEPAQRAVDVLAHAGGEEVAGPLAKALTRLAQILELAGRAPEAELPARHRVALLDGLHRASGKEPAALFPARRDYYDLLALLGHRSRVAQTRLRALTEGRDPGPLPPAETETTPDFDALARAAATPEAGPAERAAIEQAAIALSHWHFLAADRESAPHVAPHPALPNGLPMLKAFTDLDRLRLYAADHQITVPVLTLATASAAPWLARQLAAGLTHLHFNADDCSDAFYLPLRQAIALLPPAN